MNLLRYTAVELGKKIQAGEVSVLEATQAVLDAIKAKEAAVNSFVTNYNSVMAAVDDVNDTTVNNRTESKMI